MLRQSDGYLSGQQLCDHFQVSRTAVWKAINQLKEEGYEIEAVRKRVCIFQVYPCGYSGSDYRRCDKKLSGDKMDGEKSGVL